MFHRIMEAGNTRQRVEPIAIPDSDTTKQEEPQSNSPKMTTTFGNTEEVTDRTMPQPTESPQTEEPAIVERNEPAEPGPPTQGEVDAMETPTMTEQVQDMQLSNDTPTGTTPSSDQYVGVEPNIRDILEDE